MQNRAWDAEPIATALFHDNISVGRLVYFLFMMELIVSNIKYKGRIQLKNYIVFDMSDKFGSGP